jgi:hypothetical protein
MRERDRARQRDWLKGIKRRLYLKR